MSMGILDFSTQSTNTSYTTTVTKTDSENRSTANNEVMDNVGNTTINLGAGANSTWDKLVPILAVGLLAFGMIQSGKGRS